MYLLSKFDEDGPFWHGVILFFSKIIGLLVMMSLVPEVILKWGSFSLYVTIRCPNFVVMSLQDMKTWNISVCYTNISKIVEFSVLFCCIGNFVKLPVPILAWNKMAEELYYCFAKVNKLKQFFHSILQKKLKEMFL